MLCFAVPLTVLPELVKSDCDCRTKCQDVEQEGKQGAEGDARRLCGGACAALIGCSVRWFVRTEERCELIADGVEIRRGCRQAFDREVSANGVVVASWRRRDRDAGPFGRSMDRCLGCAIGRGADRRGVVCRCGSD
eukprot:6128534-Pleurochrysis_carterae.AAC.2